MLREGAGVYNLGAGVEGGGGGRGRVLRAGVERGGGTMNILIKNKMIA